MMSSATSLLQLGCRSIERGVKLLTTERYNKSFRCWQNYLCPQKIAGYIGFLGYDNLGDEILYYAFKKLFKEYQIIVYDQAYNPVYRDPKHYHPLELHLYRRLIKPKFYDLVLLGGGTLIRDRVYRDRFQHALQFFSPGIVFGTGVGDPVFWQECQPERECDRVIKNWVEPLKQAAYLSVRGARSARILAAYGLSKPRYIGDPALSACSARSLNFTRKKTLAINLGSHSDLWGNQAQVNKTIAKLAHQLLASGWQIEFLPFHPGDLKLGRGWMGKFGLNQISLWQGFRNIPATLKRIPSYDLVIGQRLHSAVLACGCGVPFISLNYQPKCEDFLETTGLEQFGLRTDALDLDRLLSLVREIETNYVFHCQRLTSIGNYYRHLQQQAAREVMALVTSLRADPPD